MAKTQTVVVANLTYVYQVVEKGTLKVVSTHSTRVTASRKVDRLDNAYGCYHYFVRQQYKVEANPTEDELQQDYINQCERGC